MDTFQVRFIWTNSELERAAKHRRETKKGFTVALTAVLTSPGSKLLQSCVELAGSKAACWLVCRFG